ncbi:MAG TPA: hydroxysqualene dehydroxylase HpnE [Pseudolabrys sp.]|jgi:squalene-associated FAD-dependent desaturase|nr:hydroxysqualene dehydroxylase HpnE [Pseudolabrys sp.]
MPSSDGTVHIIGAGIAGLAAAVRLTDAGRTVVVHEATGQAGGRCRSYYDHTTSMVIDNGTHLLLSGNHAALNYLKTIGAETMLEGPADAEFQFIDLEGGARWTVRFNNGLFPWWIFDKSRRVPQTRPRDYLPLARLLWASGDQPLEKLMTCSGPLYDRLLEPLFLAALNVVPPEGSGKLAGQIVRETLVLGGKACRPLIAPDGIGTAFIDPAVAYLNQRGVVITMHRPLHALGFAGTRISQLDFGQDAIALGERDQVILAVPSYAAAGFIPGLQVPSSFRSIVNAHYRIDPPPGQPRMIGVVNGTAEWVFALPGRVAVTVSDAGDLLEMPRTELAQVIWRDVAAVMGLPETLPPWQIVRERRATFAATPEENAKRPGARTNWGNLVLAGDWTATGLPATIEGAVRSGNRAADLVGGGKVNRAAA